MSATRRLACGPLVLDRPARRALLSGRDLLFTPKAVAVLDYLMTHPDEVISRERLKYPIIAQEIYVRAATWSSCSDIRQDRT